MYGFVARGIRILSMAWLVSGQWLGLVSWQWLGLGSGQWLGSRVLAIARVRVWAMVRV